MTTYSAAVGSARVRPWRPVIAVVFGNALGWFDFAAYGFFAVTLAKLFFPTTSDSASILLVFATFGVTFITRPLGAVVIGSLADRQGRKAALTVTVILSAVATAIIGLAPPFASIGLAAPALIVVARMIQGLAAGGEFGTATSFLTEQEPHRRGFFASWQFSAQMLMALLAALFGVLLTTNLTPAQVESWGWRVPFLFGAAMGPVAYILRGRLHETTVFKSTPPLRSPVQEVFRRAKGRLLACLGLVVFGTAANYTVLFMPAYATHALGFSLTTAFWVALVAAAIQAVLLPLAGLWSDRVGRVRLAIPTVVAGLVAAVPLFAVLVARPSIESLLLVEIVLAAITACYGGAIAALMADLFTPTMRTVGVAVTYSLGVALFGGFAPFINTLLVDVSGSKLAPGVYLMTAAAASLAALIAVRRARLS